MDDIRHVLPILKEGVVWSDQRKQFYLQTGTLLDPPDKHDPIAWSAKEYLRMMNSVCSDLTFTAETKLDFVDNWLPKLDCALKF